MKVEKYIPRNEAGTKATLVEMLRLCQDAAIARPCPPMLQTMVQVIAPRRLDAFLRHTWNYVPDGEIELLRTVPRLLEDQARTGYFEGDCDDACIIAGACLILQQPGLVKAALAAVRRPHDTSFSHVFCLVLDRQGTFRVDPTAPMDADYQNWEMFTVRLF